MTESLCPAAERRQALHMMLEKNADGGGDDAAGGDGGGDGGDEDADHVADDSSDDDHGDGAGGDGHDGIGGDGSEDGGGDEDADRVGDDSSDMTMMLGERRARAMTFLSLFVSAAALGPGFALSGSCLHPQAFTLNPPATPEVGAS